MVIKQNNAGDGRWNRIYYVSILTALWFVNIDFDPTSNNDWWAVNAAHIAEEIRPVSAASFRKIARLQFSFDFMGFCISDKALFAGGHLCCSLTIAVSPFVSA